MGAARGLAALGVAMMVAGCGSEAARRPPGIAPSPRTVTVAEPGGDAHDPHRAALERLLEQPWGWRSDKDDQVHAPLPDWEHWKRVRYWGIQHFAGWRYGDDHHAVTILVVQELPSGAKRDSETCLERFEAWARPRVNAYDVKLGPISVHHGKWRGEALVVKEMDGHVDAGFGRKRWSAAWTAYPAYPNACLVYAVAVQWGEHEAQARAVRDRWVREAFERMEPLTKERPYRR